MVGGGCQSHKAYLLRIVKVLDMVLNELEGGSYSASSTKRQTRREAGTQSHGPPL